MFVDHVTINIKAGTGGNGMVAFRREKYEPMAARLVATVVAAEALFLKSMKPTNADGFSV